MAHSAKEKGLDNLDALVICDHHRAVKNQRKGPAAWSNESKFDTRLPVRGVEESSYDVRPAFPFTEDDKSQCVLRSPLVQRPYGPYLNKRSERPIPVTVMELTSSG